VPNRKLQHPYEIVKLERNEIVSHLFCAVNPNRVPPVAHVWVDRLLVLEVRGSGCGADAFAGPSQIFARDSRSGGAACTLKMQQSAYDSRQESQE